LERNYIRGVREQKRWFNGAGIDTGSCLRTMYDGVIFTWYNKGKSSCHVAISESVYVPLGNTIVRNRVCEDW
jgi:hypothetical protein